MTHKKIFSYTVVFVLIVVSAILLTFRLDALSYWGDEVGSIMYSRCGFFQMIDMLIAEDVHPPLYYMILHWWIDLWGESEFALRFLSVIPVIISIVFVYRIGKDFFSEKVGLLSALMFVMSPEIVLFGRMVRYYTLALLFGLMATYFFFKLLKKAQWKYVFLYACSVTLLLYTTYTTVSLIIAHGCILLFWIKQERQAIFKWISAQCIAFLLYIPGTILFFMMISRMSSENNPLSDLSAGASGVAVKFMYSIYAFCFGETLYPWHVALVVPGCIVIFCIFMYGIRKSLAMHNKHYFFLLLQLAIPLVFTVILLSTVKKLSSFVSAPSRTLFVIPYFCLALAVGIEYIRDKRLKIFIILFLLSIWTVSLVNYYTYREFIMPTYLAPWKEVLHDAASDAREYDLVVGEETRELNYYYAARDYPFHFLVDEKEITEYLLLHPEARLYYIKTGRDQQPSGLSLQFRDWIAREYVLKRTKAYVKIDDFYKKVKKLLLKRKPYAYKMELLVYEK